MRIEAPLAFVCIFYAGFEEYPAGAMLMCLSTVFLHSSDMQKEVMKDVARIEAEGEGYWLTNLFGEKRFVAGTIRTIDLVEGHFVMLEKRD